MDKKCFHTLSYVVCKGDIKRAKWRKNTRMTK